MTGGFLAGLITHPLYRLSVSPYARGNLSSREIGGPNLARRMISCRHDTVLILSGWLLYFLVGPVVSAAAALMLLLRLSQASGVEQ